MVADTVRDDTQKARQDDARVRESKSGNLNDKSNGEDNKLGDATPRVFSQEEVNKIHSTHHTEVNALKKQLGMIDDLKAEIDVLKAEQSNPDISTDQKAVKDELRLLRIDLAKAKLNAQKSETQLTEYRKQEETNKLRETATQLAVKYNIPVDELLKCEDETSLYKAVLLNGTSKPTGNNTDANREVQRDIITPAGGGKTSTEQQKLDELYPSMAKK